VLQRELAEFSRPARIQELPPTQREKAEAFRALHNGPGAFIIPNPWDAGTARMLTALGYPALATTSAGYAFSLGRRDGEGLVSREEVMQHARAIIAASDLPVAADLENGFGDSPEDAAETIRQAAAAGLVGGSIEDASGDETQPIYPHAQAVERVAAAVQAARALPFPFTLTARAENFLHDRPDLDDTIRRLRAFASAGADVLFAPGLPTLEAVKTVCAAVAPTAVNVLASAWSAELSLSDLAAAGAKRVSIGSGLSRVALSAFWNAAREMKDQGTFRFTRVGLTFGQVNDLMRGR
jgi:2-methylisocitrate lyase-like PEP mutase family enzyme